MGGTNPSSPIIGADGTLYLVTDSRLMAYKTPTGPALSSWPMEDQNAQRTRRAFTPARPDYRVINDPMPTWSWPGDEAGETYRIKLNDLDLERGATETDEPEYTPESPLEDGLYTLFVQSWNDASGWSRPEEHVILIDTLAPVTIASVSINNDAATLSLSCSDNSEAISAGCSETLYSRDGDAFYIWSHPLSLTLQDVIHVCSTDKAGNIETAIRLDGDQATSLSLAISDHTLRPGERPTITGKLTRLPEKDLDLSDLEVSIAISAPNGETSQHIAASSSSGQFELHEFPVFSQRGTYKIQAFFSGTALLASSSSATQIIQVGACGSNPRLCRYH